MIPIMDTDSFAARLAIAINKGEPIVIKPKSLVSIIRNVFLVAHQSTEAQIELINKYEELTFLR